MAGGKETPRQKMIGMMYLVLTALLALNVSKQIIAAFITINDKLDYSSQIIGDKVQDNYQTFNAKKATLLAQEADLTEFNQWNEKAKALKSETAAMVGFILGECNDMIVESEGQDWVENRDEDGHITQLKPLIEIKGMDNYDIPTNMFVGGNPKAPNERGMGLRNKIHDYRNLVCGMLGTYHYGEHDWKFVAPAKEEGLHEALKTANPEDTAQLAQFYRALSIPEKLHAHGEETEMPWASVTFDHAPIVAAAAMFTSLKLDLKNAESQATDYMLSKIDASPFPINKIVPTALAPTSYINFGDSIPLDVIVAAFDTTKSAVIKWGMDADTVPERWTETTGQINLSNASPGPHRVKGVIGIEERGSMKWKPWEYNFNVGQPMGVIAQPKRRILYRGYENILEGTASGFPSERVRLSSSNVTLTKSGNQWKAVPKGGSRTATISVVASKEDGNSVNVGSYDFTIRPLPKPTVYFGSISNGQNPTYSTVTSQRKINVRYDESVTLPGVKFKILEGSKVTADGIRAAGKVNSDGTLDKKGKSVIRQSRGKQVTFLIKYSDPSGTTSRVPLVFNVR